MTARASFLPRFPAPPSLRCQHTLCPPIRGQGRGDCPPCSAPTPPSSSPGYLLFYVLPLPKRSTDVLPRVQTHRLRRHLWEVSGGVEKEFYLKPPTRLVKHESHTSYQSLRFSTLRLLRRRLGPLIERWRLDLDRVYSARDGNRRQRSRNHRTRCSGREDDISSCAVQDDTQRAALIDTHLIVRSSKSFSKGLADASRSPLHEAL